MSADFPKFFSHENEKLPNRVAYTPTDEVNLTARGYKQVETKAAQKTADETANSNTGGGEADTPTSAKKRAESKSN